MKIQWSKEMWSAWNKMVRDVEKLKQAMQQTRQPAKSASHS